MNFEIHLSVLDTQIKITNTSSSSILLGHGSKALYYLIAAPWLFDSGLVLFCFNSGFWETPWGLFGAELGMFLSRKIRP